jgi:uncharacterized protein (DUF342 family)
VVIKIQDARPGMALLKDINLPDGRVLLNKNHILTDDSITLLLKNPIIDIDITNPSDSEKPTKTSPKIIVKCERNESSARMIIEPSDIPDTLLTVEMMKKALDDEGVIFGVDEKALNKVADNWAINPRRYEIDYVALGSPAEPGKEGGLRLNVKVISGYGDLDEIQRAKFYWQIADLGSRLDKVISGTVIGEKEIECYPVPGSNVKGIPVFTDEVVKSKLKLDKGVSFSKDGNQVLATTTGFAYYFDDLIGVIPVNFDGSIEVIPSTDKMSARLVIHAPGDGGKMPQEREFRELFAYKKVTFGIHEPLLKQTLFEFTQGIFSKEPLTIAEGIPPKSGENGKLEFLFNIETSLKPKENPDGTVDYKNVEIIISVAKGQRLVKVIPPTKGTPGRNISGDTVACQDGAPAKHPQGQNTEIDPKDQTYLVASIDGVVSYNGIIVEVTEGYVINGNVDFSTGHVNYEKSVIVAGDVKGGFDINCGGNLQIGGVIEDCHIQVGSNILCKYGFVGQGKGVMESKGNINLGFMKNQIVKCRQSVNIAKEAINCTIFARKKIHIHGAQLSAAGGYLMARDSITLYTVGNHSGIRTTLEVGVDYTMVEEFDKTEVFLKELTANYGKLVESHSKYLKLQSIKGKLPPNEKALMDKLVQSMAKYKQQMDALEERKKLIRKKMYYMDIAFIRIERMAHSGTLIKIGERHHLIKDELNGPKLIRMIDHEIRIL